MAATKSGATAVAAREHVLAPAQEMAKLGRSVQPVLTHGEGIYVYDEAGRRLIDGPAGMWCAQVGYGRQEIVDAISEQAMALPYASPWYMSTSPSARLAAKIATLTPGDLNRVFFTTGGSTAVDSALRFTEFYNNVLGRPEKKKIIVRMDGYHGSTSLTAACTGRTGNWPNFDVATDPDLVPFEPQSAPRAQPHAGGLPRRPRGRVRGPHRRAGAGHHRRLPGRTGAGLGAG